MHWFIKERCFIRHILSLVGIAVYALFSSLVFATPAVLDSASKPRIALHPLNTSHYRQQQSNADVIAEMITALLMIELGSSTQFELLDRSLISALFVEKSLQLRNDELESNQAALKKLPIADFTLVGSLVSTNKGDFFRLKLYKNSSGQILGTAQFLYTLDSLQVSLQQAHLFIQQWIRTAHTKVPSESKNIAFGHFVDVGDMDRMLMAGSELSDRFIEQFVKHKKYVVLARTQMLPLVFEAYLRGLQYTNEQQMTQQHNADYLIYVRYRFNERNISKPLSIYLYFDRIKSGRDLLVLQAENWEAAYRLIDMALTRFLAQNKTGTSTTAITSDKSQEQLRVEQAFALLALRKQVFAAGINVAAIATLVGSEPAEQVYQWLIKKNYLSKYKGSQNATLSCVSSRKKDQFLNLSHTVSIPNIDADTAIQLIDSLGKPCYSPGLQVKYFKSRSRRLKYTNQRNWLQKAYRDKQNIEAVLHFVLAQTTSQILINGSRSLPVLEFFEAAALESPARRHMNLVMAADAFAASVYIDSSYLKARVLLGYSLCQPEVARCAAGNMQHAWVVDHTQAARRAKGGIDYFVMLAIKEQDNLIFLAADAISRVGDANLTKDMQRTLVRAKYHLKQAEAQLKRIKNNKQGGIAADNPIPIATAYVQLIKEHCLQFSKRPRRLDRGALKVTETMDALAILAQQNPQVANIRLALFADLASSCPSVYPHFIVHANAVAPFVLQEQGVMVAQVVAGGVQPVKISRLMKIAFKIFEARVAANDLKTAQQYIKYLTDYYQLKASTAMDIAYLYHRIGDIKTAGKILHDYGRNAFTVSEFVWPKVNGEYEFSSFTDNGLLKFVQKDNTHIYYLYGKHRLQYGLVDIPGKWGLVTSGKRGHSRLSGNRNRKHPDAFGFGNGGEYFGKQLWASSGLIKTAVQAKPVVSEIYPEIELTKLDNLNFAEQTIKSSKVGSHFVDYANEISISGFPQGETAGPLLDSYFSRTFTEKTNPDVTREVLFNKGYLTPAGIPSAMFLANSMQQQLKQDFPEHANSIRNALRRASHIKEAGYVQIYQQKGTTWALESSLIPEDAIKQRHFGRAVAIAGEYALICDGEDGIYSYHNINGQWQQQQRITEKCYHIVMTAMWAVVGAREKAVVYKNEQGFWHKTQVLRPDNYLINKDKRYKYGDFASSIAIYRETLAIGNPLGGIYRKGEPDRRGEVYIFTLDNAKWQQSAIINPQKSSYYFGKSIALTANALFVGDTATGGDFESLTQGSGSVFVFSKENTEWVLKEQLVPKGKPRSERFGLQVLLMQDNLLIKAFKNIYRYSL